MTDDTDIVDLSHTRAEAGDSLNIRVLTDYSKEKDECLLHIDTMISGHQFSLISTLLVLPGEPSLPTSVGIDSVSGHVNKKQFIAGLRQLVEKMEHYVTAAPTGDSAGKLRLDDDLKDGALSDILSALAKQLGPPNDYYFPLLEAAKHLREPSQPTGDAKNDIANLVNLERAQIRAEVAEQALRSAREVFIRVTASLAAAISLLEAGGKAAKKGAASDKMFDQMIVDYQKALAIARAALAGAGEEGS